MMIVLGAMKLAWKCESWTDNVDLVCASVHYSLVLAPVVL